MVGGSFLTPAIRHEAGHGHSLRCLHTHHGRIRPAGGETRTVVDDGGALVGPDGNAVQLERELAKIDANRVRYGTSAELVSRRMALLRYAAGDGNS